MSRLGSFILVVVILVGGMFLFGRAQRPPAESAAVVAVSSENSPSRVVGPSPALSSRLQAEKPGTQDEAGDLRPLTTPQVIKLSTRIIMAKCLSVNVRELTGGNIFTFSEFETLEVLKGKPESTKFTLRLYGGRLGNREIDSSPMPQFVAGEEVILSLGLENLDGYPTIFPQGTFRISFDSERQQRIVISKTNGLSIFSAKDKQPYSATALVPLDDFLFSLRKAIASK